MRSGITMRSKITRRRGVSWPVSASGVRAKAGQGYDVSRGGWNCSASVAKRHAGDRLVRMSAASVHLDDLRSIDAGEPVRRRRRNLVHGVAECNVWPGRAGGHARHALFTPASFCGRSVRAWGVQNGAEQQAKEGTDRHGDTDPMQHRETLKTTGCRSRSRCRHWPA